MPWCYDTTEELDKADVLYGVRKPDRAPAVAFNKGILVGGAFVLVFLLLLHWCFP